MGLGRGGGGGQLRYNHTRHESQGLGLFTRMLRLMCMLRHRVHVGHFDTDTRYAGGTLLRYTLLGIAHPQCYAAASVSIHKRLEGNLGQHSIQISDRCLAFVEFDSIQ